MKTAEIKRRFLAHFEANGHTVVPSAPLPAIEDPNLLFINAGMVQFVPYFLGQRTPPFVRATSVQKSARTPFVMKVFRPFRTHSSPSRLAVERRDLTSDPACGSVTA